MSPSSLTHKEGICLIYTASGMVWFSKLHYSTYQKTASSTTVCVPGCTVLNMCYVLLCVCTQYIVFYPTVEEKTPPQAMGAFVSIIVHWTCDLLSSLSLSFLPPIILSSSNRPSLRMMRGHVRVWWQRSTAHNALCQGKIKTGQEEKHSPSDACLCVRVCVCTDRY